MTHTLRLVRTVAILVLGVTRFAAAQTTGTLSGSIVDSSGAVLPGVQITVRQLSTGFTRSTITAADGRFVVAGISAGPYEVRAELSGFRPAMRADIVVTVGEVLTLPSIPLELGGVQEAVTVTSSVSRVNTQTSELSYLVSEQAIATLPLNGRNYTDLTLLQPGVIAYPSRDGGSVVAHGLGMSVNGQDYRSNVYLLDGTLLNDFTNGPAGSAAGTTLGIESIQSSASRRTPTARSSAATSAARSTSSPSRAPTPCAAAPTSSIATTRSTRRTTSTLPASPTSRAISSAARVGGPLCEGSAVLLRRLRGAPREPRVRRISSYVPDDNARQRRAARRPPVTICGRDRAVSERDPARQRPVDRRRLRDAHLQFRADGRSGFPAGSPGPSAGRRRISSSRRYTYDDVQQRLPTDYPQFPRSFISTNQFCDLRVPQRGSRRGRCRRLRFGYSRTRIGQNVEANLTPAAAAIRRRSRVGRRHRRRRHAAIRSAELRQPAAGAERLQRPVRPDTHARPAPDEGRRRSPSTTTIS